LNVFEATISSFLKVYLSKIVNTISSHYYAKLNLICSFHSGFIPALYWIEVFDSHPLYLISTNGDILPSHSVFLVKVADSTKICKVLIFYVSFSFN
jgi:hypothetical protein